MLDDVANDGDAHDHRATRNSRPAAVDLLWSPPTAEAPMSAIDPTQKQKFVPLTPAATPPPASAKTEKKSLNLDFAVEGLSKQLADLEAAKKAKAQ